MIKLLYDYLDPTVWVWYMDNSGHKINMEVPSEQQKVVNSRMLLNGIPYKGEKVFFNNKTMYEIDISQKIISANLYKVDYSIGMVYVHPDLEGEIVDLRYSSRGYWTIPASRVYDRLNPDGSIVNTLEDYLNNINQAISNNNDVLANTMHRNIISGNPHGTTKSMVGLGNVDNTSDLNKPVSIAIQTALNLKADIISLLSYANKTEDNIFTGDNNFTGNLTYKGIEVVNSNNVITLSNKIISATDNDISIDITNVNNLQTNIDDINNNIIVVNEKINNFENNFNLLDGTEEQILTLVNGKYTPVTYNLFSGDYYDLINKPTIPNKISQLENDNEYITSEDIPVAYNATNINVNTDNFDKNLSPSDNTVQKALNTINQFNLDFESSIKIGENVLTGVVEFVAGDNIVLNVNIDDNTITVNNSEVIYPEVFGAIGNAIYYDEITNKYYEDVDFTIESHDDTQAFLDIVNFLQINTNKRLYLMSNKRYLIDFSEITSLSNYSWFFSLVSSENIPFINCIIKYTYTEIPSYVEGFIRRTYY